MRGLGRSVRHNDDNKKLAFRLLLFSGILVLLLIYGFFIPQIVNISVQKGYKATYEVVEENLSDHNNLEIQTVCCYRTKRLATHKILSSYTSEGDSLPDITHIYKYGFESDETIGLRINVYCGYDSETKEAIFFGTDDTYYALEDNNATYGEYGNYRKVINSKFLSDLIEILY